jgi:hypothetical protein
MLKAKLCHPVRRDIFRWHGIDNLSDYLASGYHNEDLAAIFFIGPQYGQTLKFAELCRSRGYGTDY